MLMTYRRVVKIRGVVLGGLAVALSVFVSGCATSPRAHEPDLALNTSASATYTNDVPSDSPVAYTNEVASGGPGLHGHDIGYIDELPTNAPSYAKGQPMMEKADWLHDWTFYTMQRQIERADGWFAPEESRERVRHSRFRLGVYTEIAEEEDLEIKFDPDFDMDLYIPNVEKRLKLFITTVELDELPASDPTDRERGLNIGIGREFSKYADVDVGVRAKWPPQVFTKLKLKTVWKPGDWQLYPGAQFYWKSDDGFGSVYVLTVDRWIGRGLVRTTTGIRWTEESEGVEWDQSLILGYASELLEERKLGRRASARDLARGGGIRYTVMGHKVGSYILDEHRFTLFYKFAIRKLWLYGVLSPEVKFLNDRDWEAEPGIKLGFDMLFWGLGDR